MAIYIGQVAKKVLVGYQDLQQVLEANVGRKSVMVLVDRYNVDLEFLREWFDKGDQSFLESIAHLKPLSKSANSWMVSRQMKSDGQVLFAAAHRFIQQYLSQEDKDEAECRA